MAILTEVKCGKCDRRYSALRGRCPYCGARRGSGGKADGDRDNIKAQLIIGIVLLLVLIVAVTVLLITSVKNGSNGDPDPTPAGSLLPDEGSNSEIVNPTITPPPATPTPPIETPPPTIQSVSITYSGSAKVDITQKVGEVLLMKAKINPEGLEAVPVWESSNPDVLGVTPTDPSAMSANIRMITAGTATLKVTVGDKTAECIVRIKAS
ncbi:MAG: hypothetical protein LBN99_02795 [Oscillospiraceae bacterium]|jgi:hypothetical protein|nr:hypothetical protein [Oscillospiraceae bacterium]